MGKKSDMFRLIILLTQCNSDVSKKNGKFEK